MLACYIGDTSIVSLLLNNGANPLLASTEENVTCLHVCAERGFIEIAQIIISNCPELVFTVEDRKGNSCLHVATEWDYIELVRLFSDIGGRKLAVDL